MKGIPFSVLRWLNAAAFLVVVAVNALSVWLPLNGNTPGEVSDAYPNLFAPAGFTFAIWGVIYLLLFAFTVYQSGLIRRTPPLSEAAPRRIGYWFLVSCVCNAGWIFAWSARQIGVSLLLMAGLLVSLAAAYNAILRAPLSRGETLFVRIPFAVYFGWITVAAIANVTTFLVSLGWRGGALSESTWTVIVLLLGTVIALTVILLKRAAVYGLAVAWGYTGILARHVSAAGLGGAYPAVIRTAIACLALLLIAVLLTATKKR